MMMMMVTSLTDRYFITEVEGVHRAMRAEPFYKADYVSVSRGLWDWELFVSSSCSARFL